MKSPAEIRQDFPILAREVNGRSLVYLDNAASTQKPTAVINALDQYYRDYNANVHRGIHHLSAVATEAMERSRGLVKDLIHAEHEHEVIFTSGTTHSINLLASSWGRKNLNEGDKVILSVMEHHSNIVPWQMICAERGASIGYVPLTESGELDMEAYAELLNEHVKMVSLVHVSNALGTVNDVEQIIRMAHDAGALVHMDGAQAIAHMPVNVQDLDCDFYSFSGHKLFAPTGTGIFYGKEKHLEELPPLLGGGEMIKTVTLEGTTFNELPFKLEAGTPNIAGNIGLGVAIDYVNTLDWSAIAKHEEQLLSSAVEGLESINGMRFIGKPSKRSGAISFLVDGTHPSDIGTLLDKQGIAVRTGHHCTEPLMTHYDIPGTVRASFSIYNDKSDVERLIAGLERAVGMLV